MRAKNAVKYFIEAMVIIALIFLLPVAKKSAWAVGLPENLIILRSDGTPAISSDDYTIIEYIPYTHIVLNSDDLVITCNGGTVNMGNYSFILNYNEDFFTVKIKDLKLNGNSEDPMFYFCVGDASLPEINASKGKMIVEGDCEICCDFPCIFTRNTLDIVPADSDTSLSLTSYYYPTIVAYCDEEMMERTLTLGDDSDNAFNITINSGSSANKNMPALCNNASDSGNAVLTVKGNVELTCTNEYADDSDMRLIYGFEEYKFYGKVEAYCKCGPALEIKNIIYVDEDAVIKLRTGSGSTSGAVKNIGSSVLHKITFTNPGLYGAEASTDNWNAVNGEVILCNGSSGFYSKMVSNNMIAKTVVIMHRTVSDAFGDYLDKLREALETAIIKGGEQTIYWNEGTALPYDIMKTISENPNITLVFTYTYENVNYKVVLNGKNVKAYTDVPWYGPLYLNMYYGAADDALSLTGRSYVVQKGDTLTKLAVKLQTTVSNLISINSIENPNFIRVGQIINY